ncbi:2-polyprenyl-6-methoxyphenol hydroxylase-like FAD-dependent oxidoreductase [Streptomyces luteogriseus]|uniref:FAD-dependent monooxygenase n=1 Tax=Streptomyces luteogriseus TaxID=68233 RepID=UPI00277E3868|nr:FAD-dependent monooxygenase [Streptomyces luteogriseus]MDQ0714726.1 2-polyprenyl-6-methoxyphenol hydroxylase-like FAD-dependent oxidoreductase [Streptomyces luteogriseus]
MGGLTERGPATPVLVVGAGPVGLVVACELLQRDIPVRVVDAGRGHSAHSRANVVWPRNLELLDRIGVTGDLLDIGHRLAGTAFYSRGRRLATAWMSRLPDSPYPFALTLSQHDTERVLRRRFADLGGTLEEGVRLTALGNTPGGPAVKLEHEGGRVEELEPGWLVGADGAHSTVRKELGIAYDGPPVDVSFAITDARLTTTLSEDLSHYCYAPSGAMVLGPMGDGVHRIALSVPHDAYDEGNPPPLEMFQQVVDDRAAGRSRLEELLWSGSFRVRVRIASAFRSERCFLVGDAAHVISPAGGQGMNTGMQDAFNLAWKLSGVIRGEFGEAILDSYDTERRAVSHSVARSTELLTKAGLVNTPAKVALRDAAFMAADRSGLFQRKIAPQLGQTAVSYDGDRHPRLPVMVSGGAEPGHAPSRLGGGWPAVDRDRHTVLLWPGRRTPPPDWQSTRDRLRRALPEGTPVLDLTRAVPKGLAAALGPGPAVAVVRPDGHLLARLDPRRPRETTHLLTRAAHLRSRP